MQAPVDQEGTMWASEQEAIERFRHETFAIARYDFRIFDVFDNGEFITGAKVVLIEDGQVVATHEFVGSSEFADNDGTAVEQASSFACAWVESRETPLEVALAPFGSAWMLEQEEARGHSVRVWA